MPKAPAGSVVTDMRPQSLIHRALASVGRFAQDPSQYMSAFMGPGSPQPVMAPQTPEAGTIGRRMNYRVGGNLTLTPRAEEGITFPQLRFLADNCDMLRTVIETRKDQLERLAWHVVPKEGSAIKPDDPRILAAEKFLRQPCSEGGWHYWFRMLNEDLFVVDAVTLYKHRTMGGELLSLDPMNPDTIKLLIDETGRRPQAPAAAYQQILFGVPASAYEAAGGDAENGVQFGSNEMIYRMRNPRTGRVYGYSPVEQICMTVNIAIRRQNLQLAYYTDGNIPDMLLQAPVDWQPDQLQAFQDWWDDMISGNAAIRRQVKIIPGGSEPTQLTSEPQKDPMYDEWLARVICFAFSISPQAFVKMMNRATGDTAKESADEEGLQPLKQFWCGLITEIVQEEWGDDLCFHFKDAEHSDKLVDAQAHKIYVDSGIKTRDEVRAELGDDALGGLASRLAVTTMTGAIPVMTETDDRGQVVEPTAQEAASEAASTALVASGGVPPVATTDQDNENNGESGNAPNAKKDDKADPKKEAGRTDTGALKKLHPSGSLGFMAEGHNANAVAALTPRIFTALTAAGKFAAAQVEADLAKRDETDKEKSQRISDAIALDELNAIGVAMSEEVLDVYQLEGTNALLMLGITPDVEMFNQVDAASVEYAEVRSAELVTQITETTRAWLRDVIAQGLKESKGNAAIAADIASNRSFSLTRAQLIATTEVGNANGAGALEGYKKAAAAGVDVKKQWLLADAPCPICEANAAEGPLPLDQVFSSGDLYPLAHPNCKCTTIPVVS